MREGKLDLAIDEYLRLVEDQPGDVGAANALGDLYAKVGNRAPRSRSSCRIGDTHRESGFIPKAIAFYKKALKVDPASDHALSQLAQIAVEQELFADATLYLNRLLQRRREQKQRGRRRRVPGAARRLSRPRPPTPRRRRRAPPPGTSRRPRRRGCGSMPPTRWSAPAAPARRSTC